MISWGIVSTPTRIEDPKPDKSIIMIEPKNVPTRTGFSFFLSIF